MKIKKLFKNKKVPLIIAGGVILAGLGGGAYYLATQQDKKMANTTTNSESSSTATTDSQVQQNIESKAAATGDESTTSTTEATTPAQATLADVSLSVIIDPDKTEAYVYLYGPSGTYGIEKLVGSSWNPVIASFDYSGRGGYSVDTISSSTTATHYRVFKLSNGSRTAVSGDTEILWQDILDKGTVQVQLRS